MPSVPADAVAGRRVCVFYLGDFHAAGRCSCDQNPSQTWPPLT
jgi:hypothetical protein